MFKVLLRNVRDAGSLLWQPLPRTVREGFPGRVLGNCVHALARKFSPRAQSDSTWFFRNEPLLSTLVEIINSGLFPSEALRICSMACSSGAELYSFLWLVRNARPDLQVIATGVDISQEALEKAKEGCYARGDMELRGSYCEEARRALFESDGKRFRVRGWLRQGIRWIQGDARDPAILSMCGPQDIVLANNFLVHMVPRDASAALVNVSRLVTAGGILVCRGIDLSVRQKIASHLGFTPIPTRIEQIHNAEPDLDARLHWPWSYYGLEPLNPRRKDWIARYASIFQAAGVPTRASSFDKKEPVPASRRAAAAGGR